jgi:DNA mismatch repair ATPase MutS
VLAQAGAPVCAQSMSLTPVLLGSSFRIRDSLENGISLFMAEVRRVKQVVDQAAAANARGRTLVFLLDEILHGTNTLDRRHGVAAILDCLHLAGAIGAVTSHDVALASEEALIDVVVPVHFAEHFVSIPDGGTRMAFDYKLKEGAATTSNALKLLEIAGLPVKTRRAERS